MGSKPPDKDAQIAKLTAAVTTAAARLERAERIIGVLQSDLQNARDGQDAELQRLERAPLQPPQPSTIASLDPAK